MMVLAISTKRNDNGNDDANRELMMETMVQMVMKDGATDGFCSCNEMMMVITMHLVR